MQKAFDDYTEYPYGRLARSPVKCCTGKAAPVGLQATIMIMLHNPVNFRLKGYSACSINHYTAIPDPGG